MKTIGKFGYCTLAGLLSLDIALASGLGRKIAEYIMPNPLPERYLARALFGEARNSKDLQIAVANVIQNRVKDKRWPNTVEEVVLQRRQFSCFNPEDPNWDKVWNPEKYEPRAWKRCSQTAREFLRGEYRDNTKGANHYHTTDINPEWSKGKKPAIQIENTKFFKL